MKLRIAVITAALLATASVAAQADTFLTDYYGFSWENGAHWTSGTEWKMDGILDDILPPLTADFGANEYTYYMSGNSQNGPAVAVGSGFDPRNGSYTIYQINYDGGRLDVYEDPAKNHDWGVNPANGTSPSTFIDGTLYLGAAMSNTVFYITRYASGNEIGSFEADLTFDGGSHWSQINFATSGYTFSGLTKNARSAIPTGYVERVDGQQFVTPVLPSTWGSIKHQYAK